MVAASKFHREAIITGYVDSFCLVCEEHLKCERDAEAHVANPKHRKNLKSVLYMDKYCDDHIRKVNNGYYCEFCNLLLATSARVNLHVGDAYHRHKKGEQLLKRVGSNVIAYNNICITDHSWNGLIDNTCVICNVEFENESIHKNERDHLINIVQCKTEFDTNNNIYRKTDQSSIQCLTCNTVLALDNLIQHFSSNEHQNLFSKCRVLNSSNLDESEVTENINDIGKDKTNDKGDDKTNAKRNDKANDKTNDEINEKKTNGIANNKTNDKTHDKTHDKTNDQTNAKRNDKASNKTNDKINEKKANGKANNKTNDKTHDKTNGKITVKKQTFKATKTETKKPNLMPNKKKGKPMKAQTPFEPDAHLCTILNAPDFIRHDSNGSTSCLLCALTLDDQAVASHINGKHHQSLLKMHNDRMKKKKNKTDTKKIHVDEINAQSDLVGDDDEGNKSNILDSIDKFQQNGVNIDLISGTAKCKVCSVMIIYNVDAINAHIEEHKKKPIKKDATEDVSLLDVEQKEQKRDSETSLHSTPVHLKKNNDSSRSISLSSSTFRDEDNKLEAFARTNQITIDIVRRNCFCQLCDTKIPYSLRNMKSHVAGSTHKTKLTKVEVPKIPKKNTVVTQHLDKFIISMSLVEFVYGKDIVVNKKICLNYYSFLGLSVYDLNSVCYMCNVELKKDELTTHSNSLTHKQKFDQSFVVTSLDSEFVRELRPGFYHCGYCNVVVEDWNELENHLESSFHRQSRNSTEWRLKQHMPHIEKTKEVRTMAPTMNIINMSH